MRVSTYQGAGIVEASAKGAWSLYNARISETDRSVIDFGSWLSALAVVLTGHQVPGTQHSVLVLSRDPQLATGNYFPIARRKISSNWLIRASFFSVTSPCRRKRPGSSSSVNNASWK